MRRVGIRRDRFRARSGSSRRGAAAPGRFRIPATCAFLRKTAAELIQRFPEVAEPLRDGRLCLSSVCELAKVLTPENRAEVLPRFFHASKQEAKAVAAEIAPREVLPQRAVVTAVARTSPAVAATGPSVGLALQEPSPLAQQESFHVTGMRCNGGYCEAGGVCGTRSARAHSPPPLPSP